MEQLAEVWSNLGGIKSSDWIYIFHVVFEVFFLYILIYIAIMYVRGTRAVYILIGIFGTYFVLNIAAKLLNFTVTLWIMEKLWAILTLACVVIFQPELRRGFASLGAVIRRGRHQQREMLDELTAAANYFAEHKTGALIVLENNVRVRAVSATGGVALDCKVSAPLLECIFMNKSPLHDGAVVINGNRITAAHVILPLARMEGREVCFGTRHRAAMGITEETDAVAVVISEERGTVSVAYRGELEEVTNPSNLRTVLSRTLSEAENRPQGTDSQKFEPEIKQEEIQS